MRRYLFFVGVLLLVGSMAHAEGFDRAGVTLQDNTSISLQTNASFADIQKWAGEASFKLPEQAANFPGITASYFDAKLVTISPVKADATLELPRLGKCPLVAALVLYPKPADFQYRWPLLQRAEAGPWLVVSVTKEEHTSLLLVRKAGSGPQAPAEEIASVDVGTRDFDVRRVRTRDVPRGSVPGALIAISNAFPYVTQIGRGCALGIAYMTADVAACADLVR